MPFAGQQLEQIKRGRSNGKRRSRDRNIIFSSQRSDERSEFPLAPRMKTDLRPVRRIPVRWHPSISFRHQVRDVSTKVRWSPLPDHRTNGRNITAGVQMLLSITTSHNRPLISNSCCISIPIDSRVSISALGRLTFSIPKPRRIAARRARCSKWTRRE